MIRRTAFIAALVALSSFSACKNFQGVKIGDQTFGGTSSSSGSVSGGWSTSAQTDDLADACTIPVHTDDYAGFDIGLPKGWALDYGGGSIEVTKDADGYTGALVYPTRLRKGDIPADKLADMFANSLAKSIERRGGTFNMSNKQSDGHIARADAGATLGGVNLRGVLQVVSEKGFATVKLYWAPDTSFPAEEAELKQVVSCFHRQMIVVRNAPPIPAGGRVTKVGANGKPVAGAKPAASGTPVAALKDFHGRYFVGQMPDGWKIADETANGIDLVAGDGQSGVGFGWVLNGQAALQPMVEGGIQRIHPGAKITKSSQVASGQPNQIAWAAEYETSSSRGLDQASRAPNVELMTSMQAATAKWDALKPTLVAILHSIQITQNAVSQVQANVRAQLATLPRAQPSTAGSPSSSSSSTGAMSQWESDDKPDKFDDAIRGQDRAVSPSTGTEYTVPYNAWNAAGPQGPGYYRITPGGGTEMLEVQQ